MSSSMRDVYFARPHSTIHASSGSDSVAHSPATFSSASLHARAAGREHFFLSRIRVLGGGGCNFRMHIHILLQIA
jgi:hypothetical protein